MRHLLNLVFTLVTFGFVNATPNGGCGTVTPPQWNSYLSETERLNPSLLEAGLRGGMRYIPVFYHIVARTDGSGAASLKDVFVSHCEMNQEFTKFNMYFYIAGIDTVKNSGLYGYATMDNNDAFPLYNKPNKCNVYINTSMPGICGEATFPGWASNGGGIFIAAGCHGEGTTTLIHEMGHYFRLLHTFETWGGVEFVNGSNCANAGDGYCDTPADFINYRATCPYTGTETDPNGDLYSTVIDESLYMSYFSDNCQNKFSTEQRAEMNQCLSVDRAYLLNQTLPDVTPLDSVTYIAPIPGDTSLNSTLVTFRWHSVPRAAYYIFRLMPTSSSVNIADTLITDTSFTIASLGTNKPYRFRVTPVSYGNTCGEQSNFLIVSTSPIKAVATVVKPNCPGGNNGTATITATNGLFPYTYLWSNGQTTVTATNLSAGTYSVTVNDSNGEVVVVNTVVVADPTVLYADITQVGNNLNAYGGGGTPPYTYAWSNGTTGQFNNNVTFGSYTVTVTDSKGCTAEEVLLYSSNGVELETKASVRVYPNPAIETAHLQLLVDVNQHSEATIRLVNISGQVVQTFIHQFSSGANQFTMPLNDVPSGVYVVELTAVDFNKAVRVLVVR